MWYANHETLVRDAKPKPRVHEVYRHILTIIGVRIIFLFALSYKVKPKHSIHCVSRQMTIALATVQISTYNNGVPECILLLLLISI